MTSENQSKAADMQPYHHALSSLLLECSEALSSSADKEQPNATAMRGLQEHLCDFANSREAPGNIQFVAFFTDTIIADAFKNFFGDALSYEETDQARRDLCSSLSLLFAQLSEAILEDSDLNQYKALQTYVTGYLDLVRDLNDHWVQSFQARGA